MPDRYRVLHIFDHSLPHQDGYSSRSIQIMAAQRRKGWQPVGLTSPKHEVDCGDKGVTSETIQGFTFYRCGAIGHFPPGMAEIWLMIKLFRRISEIVKKLRPDIFHVHSPVLNTIPAILAGKWFNIPLVYEIRAFWEDAGADQGTYRVNSLKYRLVRLIETICCIISQHVTVICRGLKNDLAARGVSQKKISIIYNAIHPDNFIGADPNEGYRRKWNIRNRKIVGFIGSFYRYEGLDTLISAFAKISAVRNDIVMLLVGGGETEDELKSLIARMHLTDQVVMPGRVPHDRVPSIYAMMNVLVYPRHSIRLTELVTPLKPLEAMAMGKPVVATDIAGHRELIRNGHNGILVAPDDPHALAEAIIRILGNETDARRLGENGRQLVQRHFNWNATTSPYAPIYKNLVRKTDPSGYANETSA